MSHAVRDLDRAFPPIAAGAACVIQRRADAAVIATGWPSYRDLDWAAMHGTMRRPLIIDGSRLLAQEQLQSTGYVVELIGDGVDRAWTDDQAVK